MRPENNVAAPEPFSLSSFFPGMEQNRAGCLLFDYISGLMKLRNLYRALPACSHGRGFLSEAQNILGIDHEVIAGRRENIPQTGPAVVVANHPFGGADGIILAGILTSIRPDVRILANHHLKKIPEVGSLLIGVDPFAAAAARKRNVKPLREAINWLQRGGVLLTFPAGEVSHFHLSRLKVTDPEWNNITGRIIRLTRVPAIPVCFHGRNSLLFNLLGLLHPLARTCLLPRELVHKMNATIELSIGKAIPYKKLKKLDDADAITRYLRLRTYMLANTVGQLSGVSRNEAIKPFTTRITSPVPVGLLRAELDHLPGAQLLLGSGTMQVYIAKAGQAPWLMQEIGRLRELTFRRAGEGTGKSADIDLFDSYYRHLFVWDTQQQRIAGAYRIGIVDEILEKYGPRGLYTYTLFKFRRKMLAGLGHAVELGRSFVHPEYQRSYLALNLLWKGIAMFISERNYPILFGPVSISKEYTLLSRRLLVNCLQNGNYESALAKGVKPRHPFRNGSPLRRQWKDNELPLVKDIDLVSDIISQYEHDEKGVPVLVRQYLKLGGKFLGFNVDREFNDVIDGLILVDLRETDVNVLQKYMGRDRACDFLRYHKPVQNFPGLLEA